MLSSPVSSTATPLSSHLRFAFAVPFPRVLRLPASSPEVPGVPPGVACRCWAFRARREVLPPGPDFACKRCPEGVLGREASGVTTGVASVLLFTTSSFLAAGMAFFRTPGGGGGGSSRSVSWSSPADEEGGVNSVGPSESLCLLAVEPVSRRLISASNVWSNWRVSRWTRSGFLSSEPYCLRKRVLTAARRSSTHERLIRAL